MLGSIDGVLRHLMSPLDIHDLEHTPLIKVARTSTSPKIKTPFSVLDLVFSRSYEATTDTQALQKG